MFDTLRPPLLGPALGPRPPSASPGASLPCAVVTLACLVASAVFSGPAPDPSVHRGAGAPRHTAPTGAVDCRLGADAGAGAALQLVNTTPAVLETGQRLAWASTGTPNPVGGVLVLPRPLSPGESLVLVSGRAVHAMGCQARVPEVDRAGAHRRWP